MVFYASKLQTLPSPATLSYTYNHCTALHTAPGAAYLTPVWGSQNLIHPPHEWIGEPLSEVICIFNSKRQYDLFF